MDTIKILDRIEEILKEEGERKVEQGDEVKSTLREFVSLILQFVLSMVKAPFLFISRYLKNEIINSLKKDSKLLAAIFSMLVVLLVFFFVFWLFVSASVGIYFYENGSTMFTSIMYSIAFQAGSSLIIVLVAYISFRKVKSIKLMKSLFKVE
jgi:magnesium-transporting ATPase (P-type)